MNDLETQINARVEAFLADIAALARRAGHDALRPIHEQEHAAHQAGHDDAATGARGRGKRSPEERAQMAEEFLAYVTRNPGERMEKIARDLGYPTHALRREVKKLLAAGRVRMEGQTRASTYFPAMTPDKHRRRVRRRGRRG